jgi:hypothetical protein
MSKLASALGEKYQANALNLKTKAFELAGHTFKVRIPLTKELDDINSRIDNLDEAEMERRYQKMVAPMKGLEGIEERDNDVFLDGRSTREMVKFSMQAENRIVEYVRLLVPETGSLEDITYEEIEAEWSLPIQLEIVSKIAEAIQPGYKDTRKN